MPVKFDGYPLGTRADAAAEHADRPPQADRCGDGIEFLRVFGKPERLLSCDCERNDNTTLAQALQLITGDDREPSAQRAGQPPRATAEGGQIERGDRRGAVPGQPVPAADRPRSKPL